jgi:hypothetical protein
MSTNAAWLPLVEAIDYVANKSEEAWKWAKRTLRFKDGTEPGAVDITRALSQGLLGPSLLAFATDAIKDAAVSGKLRCRGVDPRSGKSVKIKAGEWAHLELSTEGKAYRGLCVVYDDIVVDGRQLRRLFPSGKGGTPVAEMDCGAWLGNLARNPVRRKNDVWKDAQRQCGPQLSYAAFKRSWKATPRMNGSASAAAPAPLPTPANQTVEIRRPTSKPARLFKALSKRRLNRQSSIA